MKNMNLNFLSDNLDNLVENTIYFNNICLTVHETKLYELFDSQQVISSTNEYFQIIISLTDDISITALNNTYFVQKGHSFIFTCNTDYTLTSGKKCTVCSISFSITPQTTSKESLDFYMAFKKNKTFNFPLNIENLFKTLTVLESKIEFLHIISTIYASISSGGADNTTNNLSAQIISYMKMHYASPIQIMNISKVFNSSYRTLSRTFKIQTGITMTNKLNEIRIDAAKQHLSTNMPINEISKTVGYTNEYYFSNIFKKTTGMSPTKYRTMIKSN